MARKTITIIECDRCKKTVEEEGSDDEAFQATLKISASGTDHERAHADLCPKCQGVVKRLMNDFARDVVFPDEELNKRGANSSEDEDDAGKGSNGSEPPKEAPEAGATA